VALVAIDGFMYPYKWEGGFIVNFCNVFDDPRLCCMATCAIISNRLVVHVAVATYAGRACFFEIQIRMTSLTFDIFMLAF
jgi:hypothetical protein